MCGISFLKLCTDLEKHILWLPRNDRSTSPVSVGWTTGWGLRGNASWRLSVASKTELNLLSQKGSGNVCGCGLLSQVLYSFSHHASHVLPMLRFLVHGELVNAVGLSRFVLGWEPKGLSSALTIWTTVGAWSTHHSHLRKRNQIKTLSRMNMS